MLNWITGKITADAIAAPILKIFARLQQHIEDKRAEIDRHNAHRLEIELEIAEANIEIQKAERYIDQFSVLFPTEATNTLTEFDEATL